MVLTFAFATGRDSIATHKTAKDIHCLRKVSLVTGIAGSTNKYFARESQG